MRSEMARRGGAPRNPIGGISQALRLSAMEWNEKESRDEPEEFLIHGRAYLWAMDMPQSKRDENRNFAATEPWREWQSDAGE